MPKGGTDPCVYMERDTIVGTTDAQLVYGCGIGNCIAKNKDPGNYFRESKSLILCSKKLVLVQVKKWDESPERPPPTRQNACDDSVFGWEQGEDMAEEKVG